MQTDTMDRQTVLFNDFPPALPPARETADAKIINKKKSVRIGILLRAICLMTSLSVISLCAIRKTEEIFEIGVIKYIGNELLGIGREAIGSSVSEIVLGEAGAAENPPSSVKTPIVDMPAIHYIPLDSIKNELLLQEKIHAEMLDSLYYPETGSIPENTHPIVPTDASTDSFLSLKNETSFDIDMAEISKKADRIPTVKAGSEPLVLIVHTHGTESFANSSPYYNDSINYPRSENVSENIVAVGKVLCDTLNENGIPTIHCETMHDKDSYINAYERSAESIQRYLEKYPSIQYVFDVHRDSLIRSDLTKLKPVTLLGAEACAQVMMIIGSNEKGAADYDWESNLVLAEAIQKSLFEDAPGVSRHLYLRGATYNQQYAKHGLLVEIGSCGNTLAEAKLAAKAFGEAVIKVIKK